MRSSHGTYFPDDSVRICLPVGTGTGGPPVNNESQPARRSRRGAAASTASETVAAPTPPSTQAVEMEVLQQLLMAMNSVREGDFSVQLPAHWEGMSGKLADAFNDIVNQNKRLANDLARVAQRVGGEGRTRQRMPSANRQGQWSDMESSINGLIRDMARPIETMTEAMAAVAKGDLSRTVPLDSDGRPLQGEFLRAANIVNRMLEQMSEFSSEVTRVALEVGTAGRLGGQAKVKGVSGVWKDLTDSVNQMASNLTA
ncbi:MAG: HAMP domain-containing protein, partial [Lysobacter sp.]|nr:HAMP domain-containing protein [Lysobacter sp.]